MMFLLYGSVSCGQVVNQQILFGRFKLKGRCDYTQMQKSHSLESLLRSHTVTADEFFSVTGIVQQIRGKLDKFTDYCRRHRIFTHRMLTLALNVTYTQLETNKLKAASFAINEVLSSEEPAMAELFFEEDPSNIQNNDIPEQIDVGIQSEAERLFDFDEEEEQQPQELRPIELQKQELVGLSLQILREPQRNQTCLGHLHKIYSFLIRHDPLPVLKYFSSHAEERNLLLFNLQYSSISTLVAQLLTSEDKSKEYLYEGFKRQVVQFIVKEVFVHIEDEDYFDGLMVLIEEIINTTKQSYYEYFEDFKRVANLLVTREVMQKLIEVLLLKKEQSFRNASKFMEYLVQRINTEREDNHYYNHGEEIVPSMTFEVDVFYEKIEQLVDNIPSIDSFHSLTKISYLSFLEALFNSTKMKDQHYSLLGKSFIGLLDSMNRQQKAGVYKSKLYSLINAILNKASKEQISQFLANHPNLYNQHFSSIRSANYANNKNYNKSEGAAFDVSIIRELSKKNQNVIVDASKAIGKDFKRICKKYDTKIASFQQNSSFSIEEESSFYQYSNDTVSLTLPEHKNTEGNGFALNLVGKNNISIPILHLPERAHNPASEPQEDKRRESPEIQHTAQSKEIKQIYQVQEVVNLSEKLKKLNLGERECQIQRPPQLVRKIDMSPVNLSENIPVFAPKQLSGKRGEQAEKTRYLVRHLAIFA